MQVTMRRQAVKGTHRELATMLFQPPAATEGLIVYFPGGGFITDELEACELFCRMLAVRVGLNVLAASYTLANELPFPAAIEDAHAVLSWANRYCKRQRWRSPNLIVAGLEAGGNLAAVSALMARDRGGPALTAQILMMPMLDPGLTTCSMRTASARNGGLEAADTCAAAYRSYLPHAIDRVHPYASPLQSSRMKHLPPALILSTDDDPLRDEAEHYGAKLIAAGVPTTVRRLAPVALDEPNARCSCVRKESTLHHVETFIAGLRASAAAS
ncbi:alpha/beta hydrolase [Noviherbaspirillum malthae]|uniref:alpha/beta hydrolase n=1 Tax=Noviherbaspirillum malthae TaxID=1260987 RepID=UPI00188EAADA|nr:alpha/beta hydrolase [Noviherbaspirillum malthae]